MASPSMVPMTSGKMSVREKRESRARAFENECIILRLPNVVKGPPVLLKLDNYPVLIIGKDVNRVLVILWNLCRPNFGFRPTFGLESRETLIELGVLCESKTLLALVGAKVPKDEWQPQIAIKPL